MKGLKTTSDNMKKISEINNSLSSAERLSITHLSEIKGGRRYRDDKRRQRPGGGTTTTSPSSFVNRSTHNEY